MKPRYKLTRNAVSYAWPGHDRLLLGDTQSYFIINNKAYELKQVERVVVDTRPQLTFDMFKLDPYDYAWPV